jgi:hypothetical protein
MYKGGMSPDLRRVNIYVNSAQWDLLQALRKKTGAPVAESVRRALDDYLDRQLTREEREAALKEKGGGKRKVGRS